ncbi:hypothetical protein ACM792_11285 [Metapseudomonas otitidis]|uniref:hypothetical protein n=1 Tax=Metapseudomonas otitidis TaxID=319939 RepID=UPI0039FCD2A2
MAITPLLELIAQVPNVVWSGLTAALLTLTGVFISNASNTKRLKIQLAHDASEKAKERTGKLRQEVYLLFAEELGKANTLIGSMAEADIFKDNKPTQMQGLFSAAIKLQFVAEPKTALVVGELSASYGAALLRLLAASDPLRKNRIDIDLTSKLFDEATEKATHYHGAISDLADSGQFDILESKKLNQRMKFHHAQMEKYNEERDELFEISNKLQKEFSQKLISEMKPLSSQYINAMMAIRSDLGLPVEHSIFEEQLKNHWKQMETELNQALKTFHDKEQSPPAP